MSLQLIDMRCKVSPATTNAFNWRGPSQTLDKYGRIKTERQMLLDATRVNRQEPLCAKHDTDKTQRMQKAAI